MTKERPTIGVIGHGFVGRAVARGFMEWADIRVYDIRPELTTHSLEETCASDFVFVCLPTPMKADGSCDLSVIERFFTKVNQQEIAQPIYVIKSTVPIGTTRRLSDEHAGRLDILHSPEFLTARCALVDFQTPARNIIGDPFVAHSEATQSLSRLYAARFPGVPIHCMRSDESEMVKYACNSFFAVKVAFFNELFLLAQAMGFSETEWERVRGGILADGRIAHAHTAVPGPDGRLGFGGSCLPKDLNSLMTTMRQFGIEPEVTAGAWELNKQVRKVQDWEVVN